MNCEISLAKFLSRYAHLKGKNLKKVTHDEVKILFPNLKRSTFDDVKKNPSLLYSGKVILVNDGRKTIPYYIPTEELLTQETELIRQEVEKRKINDEVYDYSKMSVYKLRCLLERKFNSCRNQSCAKNELNRRGIVLHKKYKRSEEKRKGLEGE